MKESTLLIDLRTPERKKAFKMYCIRHGKSMTEVINQAVDVLITMNQVAANLNKQLNKKQ